MRVIVLVASILLACGCSIPRSVKEGGPIAGQQIDQGGKVLILAVADGQEQGQPVATGSGQGVVSAVRKALSRHQVPLGTTQSRSLDTALDEAAKGKFSYVLKTDITLWEDNATAWSGNGDKLNLSIEVYDATTRQLVAAATHQRVATGATFVSGSPNRFMDEVATGALSQIYGWPPEAK